MAKPFYSLGELTVEFPIRCINILSVDIAEYVNEHGVMALKAIVPDSITMEDILRQEDAPIKLLAPGNKIIFAGLCVYLDLHTETQYNELIVYAKSHSIVGDQTRGSQTFQNTGKTLGQVVQTVLDPCGVFFSLEKDIPIPQMISQNDETPFAFVRRIANELGFQVFVNSKIDQPQISIGVVPFSTLDCPDFEITKEQKDLDAFLKVKANTDSSISAFEMAACTGVMGQLQVGVGCLLTGGVRSRIVTQSRILSKQDIVENTITITDPIGVCPSSAQQNTTTFLSSVITGKVLNVSGTNVLVQFDVDGPASGTRIIPYENSVSNYFYCMPDIDDIVFAYYQNDGTIICLGSKHVNDSPDFADYKNRMLTANGHMVKSTLDRLEFVLKRDKETGDDSLKTRITFDKEKGLEIRSEAEKDIELTVTTGNVYMVCQPKEWDAGSDTETHNALVKQAETLHDTGTDFYVGHSGSVESVPVSGLSDFWDVYSNMLALGFKNYEIGRFIGGLFAGPGVDSSPPPPLPLPYDSGVINMIGTEGLALSVKEQSVISMAPDGTLAVFAPQVKMVGFERGNYEKVVLENHTGKDTFLDFTQAVLGIVGMVLTPICPPAAIFAHGANAVISVARGDAIGAVMNVISCGTTAVASATKNTVQASKALLIATKANVWFGRVEYAFACLNFVGDMHDLYESISEDGWTKENISQLLGVGANFLFKTVMQYKAEKDAKMAADAQKKLEANGQKPPQSSQTEGGEIPPKVEHRGIDPVNLVTGSFTITNTDFVLPDVCGMYRLKRTYESIHTNDGQILGAKWLCSLGTRAIVQDQTATVLKEDLHLEHFVLENGIWVNQRGGDDSYRFAQNDLGYQLYETQTGKTFSYGLDGQLLSITDRCGNTAIVSYCGGTMQRLTLASGQYLDFEYEDGKLSAVQDILGRKVTYHYNGELLTSVTYPNGGTVQYQYTKEGYICGIIDPNGQHYVQNSFDEKGRVVHQFLATGEEHIILYDDSRRQNTILAPMSGNNLVYHYDKDNLVTKIEYLDGSSEEFKYDDRQNKIWEKARNGAVITRIFNIAGQIMQEHLPSGLVRHFEYDNRGNLIRESDTSGLDWQHIFDAHNNLVEQIGSIDGEVNIRKRFEYDTFGRMVAAIDGNGNRTKYCYQGMSGKVASIDMPEGTSFDYSYDAAGRCMSITGEMGMVQFGYTNLNLQSMRIDALGNTTKYFYDMLGNLTKVVLPNQYNGQIGDGIGFQYSYDAMDHQVLSIDPVGNIVATPYNKQGKLAKQINPNTYNPHTGEGLGIEYVYDEEGRRIKTVYPDGGIERIKYDSCGNIVKKISPSNYDKDADDGPGLIYEYDCENRLVQITGPDGIVIKRYVYDLRGAIIKEIGATGFLSADTDDQRIGTLYRYNAVGWLIEKREPVQADSSDVQYRLTRYGYDRNGNIITEQRYCDFQTLESANGVVHTITFDYDRQNRQIRVSDCTGAVVEYRYNSLNQRTQEKRKINDEISQIFNYKYDAAGRMVEVSVTADREGHGQTFATIKYSYDKTGNITQIVLPTGGEILREYDAADRLVAETHKEKASKINNRTEFSYDKAGNLIEIRDNLGRRTIIEYDLMNREIRRMDKAGAIQRTMYNLDGQINKVIRPNQYEADKDDGAGYQYVYDLYDRITTIVGPDGQVIQTNTYDADGRLLQQLDGVGSGAEFKYDLAGNQIRIRTIGGTEQIFQYDAQGNIIGVVDGNSNRTEYRLDKWGRITQIIKADGSSEFYAYDYAGNITASTDGEGHTTQYEYNRMGKLAAVIDPLGEKEEYHYDGQARLISKTDRNGVTVEFGYNLYGDPLFKRAKDGTLGDFYEYTPEGLLKGAISAGMRYSYEYDGMGRLVRKSASGRTLLAMAYDKNGNKVLQTDVTGKTTEFTYSVLDLLTKMCDDGGELAVYDYNPDGTIKALTHGPIRQEYGYDIDKNLSTLKVLSAGAVLTDNFYQYDGNGNRTLKRQLGGDTLYHYDPLNQLKKVEYPAYTEELFYDKAGNRMRRVAQGVEELYQYDPRNRLTAYTKGSVTTMFQYDHAGNLLTDDKARYSYDSFNRTKQVETFDGNIQINRYDAEGLRYEMEENGRLVSFIFNQNREAVSQEDNSGLNRLIRGTELIASHSNADSARMYYHYVSDEMGSTTHIVNGAGAVQNSYEYDAWGNITAQVEHSPNRFTYYGQQFDHITQQYYLRARTYNPIVGRFLQEDNYRKDSLNLYTYCSNNPIYYIDPSGNVRQNYSPQDYAAHFSFDLGGPITESQALQKVFELNSQLRSGQLTQINGRLLTKEDMGRTIDVAINLSTGRGFWGLSGATPNNHTRHPDGLPLEIQRLTDPNINKDLLDVTYVRSDGRRVLRGGVQAPGECGEFSSAAHIYNSGEYLNDYKHYAVRSGDPDNIYDPCPICKRSIIDKDKVDDIVYGGNPPTKPYQNQSSSNSSKSFDNDTFGNPREGCPFA